MNEYTVIKYLSEIVQREWKTARCKIYPDTVIWFFYVRCNERHTSFKQIHKNILGRQLLISEKYSESSKVQQIFFIVRTYFYYIIGDPKWFKRSETKIRFLILFASVFSSKSSRFSELEWIQRYLGYVLFNVRDIGFRIKLMLSRFSLVSYVKHLCLKWFNCNRLHIYTNGLTILNFYMYFIWKNTPDQITHRYIFLKLHIFFR